MIRWSENVFIVLFHSFFVGLKSFCFFPFGKKVCKKLADCKKIIANSFE